MVRRGGKNNGKQKREARIGKKTQAEPLHFSQKCTEGIVRYHAYNIMMYIKGKQESFLWAVWPVHPRGAAPTGLL